MLSQVRQQHAQVVVRLGVIGLQTHDLPQGVTAASEPTQRQVGRGQVDVVRELARVRRWRG